MYHPLPRISGKLVFLCHQLKSADFVPGVAGGFLETRLGVGLGYRLDRTWELFAELGGRLGLLFAGSMYDPDGCSCTATLPREKTRSPCR